MTLDPKIAIEAILNKERSCKDAPNLECDCGEKPSCFHTGIRDEFLSLIHPSRRAAWQGALDAVVKIKTRRELFRKSQDNLAMTDGMNEAIAAILTAALQDGFTLAKDGLTLE